MNNNKIETLYKHKDAIIALTLGESYNKYINEPESEKIQI